MFFVWVEAGGRACLTGYTELGSLSHATISIGKASLIQRADSLEPFFFAYA